MSKSPFDPYPYSDETPEEESARLRRERQEALEEDAALIRDDISNLREAMMKLCPEGYMRDFAISALGMAEASAVGAIMSRE